MIAERNTRRCGGKNARDEDVTGEEKAGLVTVDDRGGKEEINIYDAAVLKGRPDKIRQRGEGEKAGKRIRHNVILQEEEERIKNEI